MKLSAFSRQRFVKEKPVGGRRRAQSWRLTACYIQPWHGENKKAQPLGLGQEMLKRMLLITRPL
jgi:hypothetical protein